MQVSPITKCSHPIRLYVKSTDSYMYVPCGHCRNCRHVKTNSIRQRLELEIKQHEYNAFFTLTYDNQHLPTFLFDGENCHSQCGDRLTSFSLNQYSYNLANEKLNIPAVPSLRCSDLFAAASKRDVQLWLKRLRRMLDYDKDEIFPSDFKGSKSFRYFITSEYGPRTLRPHYHGLLFIDDECTYKAIEHYFFRSWAMCSISRIDFSRVLSESATSYVSKYVTCDTRLPLLLQLPETRTFYLTSKNPSIGVLGYKSHRLLHDFQERDITYTSVRWSQKRGLVSAQLPLPHQLYEAWMPQCQFRARFCDNFFLAQLNTCVELCKKLFVDFSSFDTLRRSVLNIIPNLVHYVEDKYHINDLGYSLEHDMSRCVLLSDVTHVMTDDEFAFGVPKNRTLLCRATMFCLINNFLPLHYVDLYYQFYSFLNSQRLKYQYDYEAQLSPMLSPFDRFCLIYPSFVSCLPNCMYTLSIEDELRYDMLLSPYHLTLSEFYLDGYIKPNISLRNVSHFHNMLSTPNVNSNISTFHVHTSEFSAYSDMVYDADIQFDKIRKVNQFQSHYFVSPLLKK